MHKPLQHFLHGDGVEAESGQQPSSSPAEMTPFRYSPVDVARNGGIPVFVQERLEERQRRRGSTESTDRLLEELGVVSNLCSLGIFHNNIIHETIDNTLSVYA